MNKPLLCVLSFSILLFVSCRTKDNSTQQTSAPPDVAKPVEKEDSTQPPAKTVEEQTQQQQQSAPAQPMQSNAQDFEMPPFREDPDAASLNSTLDPATVEPAAQQGYVVAQQKPKLLAQMPCFCYCNRFGHTSLHDCFTTNHAEYCDICLREAIEADQMDRQGLTAQEIRTVIVAKYHRKHAQ